MQIRFFEFFIPVFNASFIIAWCRFIWFFLQRFIFNNLMNELLNIKVFFFSNGIFSNSSLHLSNLHLLKKRSIFFKIIDIYFLIQIVYSYILLGYVIWPSRQPTSGSVKSTLSGESAVEEPFSSQSLSESRVPANITFVLPFYAQVIGIEFIPS
jgi:hypothetical protein